MLNFHNYKFVITLFNFHSKTFKSVFLEIKMYKNRNNLMHEFDAFRGIYIYRKQEI